MNIGRPREFDSDQALQAAMQVFWSKGYEATSLADLITAMNISKSSFYQTFENKHQLFQNCINYYQDRFISDLIDSLKKAKTGRTFIEDTFMSMAEKARPKSDRRGCLILNCVSEFAQKDPVISKIITKSIQQMTDVFLSAVKRAQQEGGIPANKKPLPLARYLLSSMNGLTTMIKAGAGTTEIKEVTQVVLAALD
ncbi:MAG: TetR/AcrR family transcriptional regulator [Nitrospinae bacterium]|jgi:TetR/AcrR family transcriptional regulator, transcriptional repressor for nem operon|nr:TetR/AcrR family transcriptional regulator [Nitrospinota bacterium]MDA1109842.1 TetR/AcrR family transcriptional regulator [Nitrospinota bacterium]